LLARAKIDDYTVEVAQETAGEGCIGVSHLQQSTALSQSYTWTHVYCAHTLCPNHRVPGHKPVWTVLLDEVTRQSQGIVLTLDQQ
jgi:hypothetical protein